MEWHDRVWLGLCVSVLVGGAMLWPILLSLKLDGKISAPYAVIWIPLWVYNALGESLIDGVSTSIGVKKT